MTDPLKNASNANTTRKIMELCLSPGVGGLELYAVRTAEQLRIRHIPCLAVVQQSTMTAKRMLELNIKVLSLKRYLVFFPLIAAYKLANMIDREEVDVIHMHWGKDLNLAVLAKQFAKRKVKLVYTRQMVITRPKFDGYHRYLYRHIDLFLTISKQLLELAHRFLPMPKSSVNLLYYGVKKPLPLSDQQRCELRKQFGVTNDNDIAIGLIGRIESNKGQHLLVKAIQQLMGKGYGVHGTIIGPVMDKDYNNQLQASVASQGLQKQLTFFGSHQNPIEIMAAFDVVILASEMETFGLVLIEAMRSGVAVIGTNAGGVPEIIEHEVTGLMFEPNNADDLTEKLELICRDKTSRARLAKEGQKFADEKFSLEKHYDELIHYFVTL